MPPRRPLPDLCVITALKFLEPMDQLTASNMSPRFVPLVRAANRTVKTLVITEGNRLTDTQQTINSFFISSEPNLQQLTDVCGTAIDFQPKAVRVNRWNSLEFWMNCNEDLPTVEEIATVLFSAATSLVFINSFNENCFYENCQYLVTLLQHPHWATQLESLVLSLHKTFSNKETGAPVTSELMTVLNALPVLQQLAVDFDFGFHVGDLPALTVLAQLKVLVVTLGSKHNTAYFLDVIGKQAANNVRLQIHLEMGSVYFLSKYIGCWSETLFSRVVRLSLLVDRYSDGSKLCPLFPSLTSLTLMVPRYEAFSTNYILLITTLSQHNRQLLHLGWMLNLVDQQNLDQSSTPSPFRSLPQLTSVRALTLDLIIDDHSQAKGLCLPWTLPKCQAIYLRSFTCKRCGVDLQKVLRGDFYTEHSEPTNSATALQCLRELLSKLNPHFQRQQITLGYDEPYYRTAAELFAEQ